MYQQISRRDRQALVTPYFYSLPVSDAPMLKIMQNSPIFARLDKHSSRLGKLAKRLHDLAIAFLLEGHYMLGKPIYVFPLPFLKLGCCNRDIDIRVLAGETHHEPTMRLPAVAPIPGFARNLFRELVADPGVMFSDYLGFSGANFLKQLAQSGFAQRLTLVNAALRHLPIAIRRVGPSADKYLAFAIQQHNADALSKWTHV